MTAVGAVSIRLERATGPLPPPQPLTLTGPAVWVQANAVLREWKWTAPHSSEGYDKVDFTVTWPDGETYEGRFDMTRDEYADLAGHVNGFLDWAVSRHGRVAPDLPNPAAIAAWRDTYEIGDNPTAVDRREHYVGEAAD